MDRESWTDSEIELLRKNKLLEQKDLLALFPHRTKWSVLGAKWRLNTSRAGQIDRQHIRVYGGDGIPDRVHKLLDSCTYWWACKERSKWSSDTKKI
jgi:hypothetical protein